MRLADWSPEVAELRVIAERLAFVASAVIGAAGGKPPKLAALPRPVTAAERQQRQQRLERAVAQHARLVAQLIRNDADPT